MRLLLALLVLVSSVLLASCSTSGPPEGSILSDEGNYLPEKEGDYFKYQISVRVQNEGGDGNILVVGIIIPQDITLNGEFYKSDYIYLRKGQKDTVYLHFWVKWPNDGLQYEITIIDSS